MAVNLTTASSLVASILNASRKTYGTISDVLFPLQEIQDALLAADHQVVSVLLDSKGNRLRRSFIQSAVVTDGQVITDPFEGGVIIAGRPGKPVSPGTISRLKFNPNSDVNVDGFYCVQGNIISFTGTPCTIDVLKYTPTGSLQAPDELLYLDVTGALSLVQVKEGAWVSAAEHFGSLFFRGLEMLRQGATTFPAITPFTAQA
jgi:hypothetical protein